MAYKKDSGKHNSLWSLFDLFGNTGAFLFGLPSRHNFFETFLNSSNLKRLRGFTLIELVIVIGILATFSAGAVAVLNPIGQFQKANDVRRKSDLAQIQRGLEVYYDDNGKYPPAYGALDYRITALNGNVVVWGSSWQPYMDIIPKDPDSNKKYVYFSPNGQSYYLYASLDRGTDPGSCNGGVACNSLSSNGVSANACGGVCNFAVTSTNVNP